MVSILNAISWYLFNINTRLRSECQPPFLRCRRVITSSSELLSSDLKRTLAGMFLTRRPRRTIRLTMKRHLTMNISRSHSSKSRRIDVQSFRYLFLESSTVRPVHLIPSVTRRITDKRRHLHPLMAHSRLHRGAIMSERIILIIITTMLHNRKRKLEVPRIKVSLVLGALRLTARLIRRYIIALNGARIGIISVFCRLYRDTCQ